jgi:hypothetical protein
MYGHPTSMYLPVPATSTGSVCVSGLMLITGRKQVPGSLVRSVDNSENC